MMGIIFRFYFLLLFKLFVRIIYRFDQVWISPKPEQFKDTKLFVLLNHTSLFEPLLIGAFPNSLLWQMAKRFVYPVADKTFRRPFVGFLFRLFAPQTVSLTRNRDNSWEHFVGLAKSKNSFIGIAPEGRMKRLNGLDKHGMPMNIKSGVADIINMLDCGKMLVLYSGGLHHIQSPGSGIPKLFKKVHLKFEIFDINQYKETMINSSNENRFGKAIILDLELRRDLNCVPEAECEGKLAVKIV
ncbi:MAG: 1-acyl-sn-glycerol-3-phosphate acyltransferase [Oligoflexales bacterium]